MEIKQDIRNELFKRNEIVLELEAEKNPSFKEVKKQLAEELSKPEENIDVYSVKGKFGKKLFVAMASIYDSKEDLEKMIELRKTQKQKKDDVKAVEEAKKAEAEAKAAADTKVAEEKVEEVKEETE